MASAAHDGSSGAADDEIRRRDAFILAVAHDLRGSVASIAGALDVLRAEPGDLGSAEGSGLIESMRSDVRHLEAVIDGLFDAERLEHGAVRVVRAPTSLRSLVRRVVEASGVEDRVDVDVDDATVDVDAGLVERILANLLGNVVAHTPPGTEICVCARDEDDHVLFHVDDDGPGIPDDRKERVFEPFHDGTGRGTGVGLHLVREFARLHGGDAWIEDVPGGGTSVRIRLPVR